MPFVDANGVSLHYELAGARGRSVVLMHELGGTLNSWDAARAAARRSAFACCATTSAAPACPKKCARSFPTTRWSRISKRSPSAVGLDPPYHFVTVAAAATQALRFLEKHPDRVGALVLCNPAPGVDASRAAALDERAAFAMREGMRASLPTTLALSYPAALSASRGRLRGLSRALPCQRSGRLRLCLPRAGAHQHAAHAAADPLPDDGRRRPSRHRAAACRHRRTCEKDSRRAFRVDRGGRPLHADASAASARRAAGRFSDVARMKRSAMRDQAATSFPDFASLHPGYRVKP